MTLAKTAAGILAAASVMCPLNALADFRVCNRSNAPVSVALGYDHADFWSTSEGWWPVDTWDCRAMITAPLDTRFHYLFAVRKSAVADAAQSQAGGYFCVKHGKFKLHNRDYQAKGEIACEVEGLVMKQFWKSTSATPMR